MLKATSLEAALPDLSFPSQLEVENPHSWAGYCGPSYGGCEPVRGWRRQNQCTLQGQMQKEAAGLTALSTGHVTSGSPPAAIFLVTPGEESDILWPSLGWR